VHAREPVCLKTLSTMSAGLVGERSFVVELPGARLGEDAMVAVVAQAIAALRAEIGRQAGGGIPVFPLR
jgi:hypothetical protein